MYLKKESSGGSCTFISISRQSEIYVSAKGFHEIPTEVFGNKLKVQVEDRLKFYEIGEIPKKNIDAMDEAFDEAVVAEADALKMIKKEKKKAKKRKLDEMENSSCADESLSAMDTEDANSSLIKKKKKKKHSKAEQELENVSLNDTQEEMTNDIPKKKKKKKHSDVGDISTEINGDIVQNNGDINLSSKKKKKKRMDTSMSQDY
ncbi:hypothetical protein CDAR_84051 [Caerostris darwini]|uniref:Uncharacterized protein n=1 Tax=Caerostris darwini TaxID=1538125 RepID=A0AAV4U635_9ARAC|nr:hypothetical protein CDAR_84051 [Caerostris darwini]